MNKNQICKGCLLKHYDNYYICVIDENYTFKRIKKVCPCQTCLIKSMCKIYCLPFLNFLYIALIEHHTKSDQLKERFNDMSRRGTSREEVLIFLQYFKHR